METERWKGEKVERWKSGKVKRWKGEKVERWKGGKVERWKGGKVERWKGGKVEGWKGGKVERWKGGRVKRWKGGKVKRWKGEKVERWKGANNGAAVVMLELGKHNYFGFRSQLVELYLHGFTTGKYAQYIAPEAAEATLDRLLHKGSGYIAFVGNNLAGMLIAFPLELDNDFPVDECPDIPAGQALYIAEVMVHTDYRGRGIASGMIESVLQEVSGTYSHAAIRVWEKNRPALELYRKLGFEPVATIVQEKVNADGEMFEMRKGYLVKKLRS